MGGKHRAVSAADRGQFRFSFFQQVITKGIQLSFHVAMAILASTSCIFAFHVGSCLFCCQRVDGSEASTGIIVRVNVAALQSRTSAYITFKELEFLADFAQEFLEYLYVKSALPI